MLVAERDLGPGKSPGAVPDLIVTFAVMARRSPAPLPRFWQRDGAQAGAGGLTLLGWEEERCFAGLNLREVADLAGSTGAGVPPFRFAGMLRSALRRDSDRRHAAYWPSEESVWVRRADARMLRQSIKQAEQGRLSPRSSCSTGRRRSDDAAPGADARDLQFDQAEGRIPPDIDLVALHAFVQALLDGLCREPQPAGRRSRSACEISTTG
ncbi:hypothetical protein HBB16_07515 [Pseudonocardia sp. MCCB 268]|nr:hypothetical protein [Pseudonocardia cytotoxica]